MIPRPSAPTSAWPSWQTLSSVAPLTPGWGGIITWETVKISLLMPPVMVVFVLLGMRCARLLPEKLVKRCVTVALIISGLALVIKNVI